MSSILQKSFEIGVEAVKSAPRMANAIKEGEKFLLLPRDGDHNVPIFANAPIRNLSKPGLTRTKSGQKLTRTSSGSFSDLGKLLPSVPDNFLGRNVDMYRVMGYTKERRVVTLLGPEGSGKSALAIATANYIDERSESFIDGIIILYACVTSPCVSSFAPTGTSATRGLASTQTASF